MKLTKFVLGAGIVTAFALTSCSSDEPLKGGDENISDGTTRYMTVNICDNNLTRAASDYENGEAEENKVTKVRFFFFDKNGDAVVVKNGATVNSYDVTVPDPDNDKIKEEGPNGYNISNVVSCDIIISTEKGDKLPSNIVAVTNFADKEDDDNGWLEKNYAAYTELAEVIFSSKKFENPTNGPATIANGDFNMCNSVYYDKADQHQFMVPVTAENICHEKKDARENPVTIFVERTVAKVEGKLDPNFSVITSGIPDGYQFVVPAKNTEDQDILIDGKQIYIGVNGWSVTGTTQYARLAKNMGSNWTNKSIMGDEDYSFNEPSLHRSFWETNSWTKVSPKTDAFPMGLQYNSWNDAGNYTLGEAAYVHPNAGTQDDGSRNYSHITTLIGQYNATGQYDKARTQVLVKATLLVKNGDAYEPITIANWLGSYYTYEDLREAMAGYASHVLYWSTSKPSAGKAPEGATLKGISKDEIELKTKKGGSVTDETETRRYPVYAQLTDDAANNKYWYDSAGNYMTADQINEHLVHTEPAKAWTDGATYYYFDIKHLGKKGSNAEYGVVRNHVYKFTIKGIKGLGTPVYDPDEIIIPETPEDQLGYIAATINVLSWRIVSQDVVLGQ